MADPSSEGNPLDALAEEFVARHRAGERPSAEDYAARYPQLADAIRDLFPGLVLMEGVRPDNRDATGPFQLDPTVGGGQQLEHLGDYRILREVARGGMGIVYEAEQESLGRHVALKVLPAHMLLDEQRLQRFRREARAAGRLHHTNIVPVFGVGEQQGLHYYVMQFIQGLSLYEVLKELRKLRNRTAPHTEQAPPDIPAPSAPVDELSAVEVAHALLTGHRVPTGPAPQGDPEPTRPSSASPPSTSNTSSDLHLPGQPEQSSVSYSGRPYWQSVASIGQQVAEALAYAHGQGTLHRDIKPSNLLLDTRGTVWVSDFGLAKAIDSEDLTSTGDVVGTVRYMAPERFEARSDARSDIYSLGLTLYELLTFRPAYGEDNRDKLIAQVMNEDPPPPRKLNPEVPKDLETVVLKAMAREPSQRYQAATELAEDLQRFVGDRPIKARRVSQSERLWRWCRRNPAVASLIGLIATVLVAVAVVATWAASRFGALARREAATSQDLRQTAEELGQTADNLRQANRLVQNAGIRQSQQKFAEAYADYTKALKLQPLNSHLWTQRANLYLQLGLFPEAVLDWAEADKLLEPPTGTSFANYAMLRYYVGDREGYRLVCRRLLERFGETSESKEIGSMVYILTLVPDPVVPPARLVQMAEAALVVGHYCSEG